MAKRDLAPIDGERVQLRLLTEGDLPMTLGWRNQEHIRKWFFTSAVLTAEQHWTWYQSYRHKDNDFVFVINEKAVLKRPVGQIALYNIEWARCRGELGRFMIGDLQAERQKLAQEATSLLQHFAQDVLGLRELHLAVYAHNAPAIAVYCRCGFSEEQTSDNILYMRWSSNGIESERPVIATGGPTGSDSRNRVLP
jgi:diamine N-acetyltransferase